MSGIQATKELRAAVAREEYIPIELLARALTLPSRTVLRDWRRKHLPVMKVGRSILLRAALVDERYLSDETPDTDATQPS